MNTYKHIFRNEYFSYMNHAKPFNAILFLVRHGYKEKNYFIIIKSVAKNEIFVKLKEINN